MAETKCKCQCEADERQMEQESFAMTMLKTYANTLKKVIAVLVIVIMCWLATIGGFVWYLNQYDYASYEVSTENGGNAYYSEQTGNGEIIYGESDSGKANEN